jgi:hypothetical protein
MSKEAVHIRVPVPGRFMPRNSFTFSMREADAFEETLFIGRPSKRDPYRLSLFGQHLEPDERPQVVLPIRGGTLLVTDRRLLEMHAHLEIHGAWNVKQFQGYVVHEAIDRRMVRDVTHDVSKISDAVGNRAIEDRIQIVTDKGPTDFLVSKGPEPTLSEDDFRILRAHVLDVQPK